MKIFFTKFSLINFVAHFVYQKISAISFFFMDGERPENVNNIVHRNALRNGERYFATRLRTTRAIRTQLLFHPIVWIFFVVFSPDCFVIPLCSLRTFLFFHRVSAILVREYLFDSFSSDDGTLIHVIVLPVSGILNSTDWKNDFRDT